ncbi:LOW QUALITY PROTEIN: hypothetical protein U9M48_024119 [Paspalum notatum var. saurae]|uniref:Uncharacterized protein n=1 Tax=Paspalum notatum var. saurae TaxID=547442 RepID=A0AAQ3WWB9_PASNO
MYQDLKQKFWWYGMKRDIAEYICQRVKAEHQRPAGLLQPLKIPEWKWEEIGMYFIVGLPRTQSGFDSIWVVVDRLTKVTHFIPVKTTYTGAKLAELYMSRITDGQTERTNQILEDMLRACALRYGTSWDKSLPYAEFSYNNSYQASMKMSSFQALYSRRCRTPLHWDQPCEKQIFGLEIIEDAERQVQIVKENLRIAQTRQKSYADHRRRDLEFAVGDYYHLSEAYADCEGKISAAVYWAFNIDHKLSGVHDVFHVSQLKKCLRVPKEQLQMDYLNVQDDLTYTEYPVQILETAERVTRKRVIKICKVKWSHHSAEEATWQREDDLRADYPELFASQSKNLGARFL